MPSGRRRTPPDDFNMLRTPKESAGLREPRGRPPHPLGIASQLAATSRLPFLHHTGRPLLEEALASWDEHLRTGLGGG